MDIAHQFQQITVLLAGDRLIPVLEELTMSPVPPVVGDGITRQKPSHNGGDGNRTVSKQQVNMVGKQYLA